MTPILALVEREIQMDPGSFIEKNSTSLSFPDHLFPSPHRHYPGMKKHRFTAAHCRLQPGQQLFPADFCEIGSTQLLAGP